MTIQLLSILAAAGLVVTGVSAAGDTRSAQSLPAQNLAVAQTVAPAGKLPGVPAANRLADTAGGGASAGSCVKDEKMMDADHALCHKGGFSTPLAFGLGAAAVAGIAVAVSSGGHSNSVSN